MRLLKGGLLLLLLYCSTVFAQPHIENQTMQKLQFSVLTTENGLSNGDLYTIAQDSLGFIWLGSRQGLNRYDGHEFKKFYALPGNTNSLPQDNISTLAYSPDNILWIGTVSSGLVSYNPINDKFTHYKEFLYNSRDDGYPKIIKIFNDAKGSIWVSTDDGKLIRLSYVHNNLSIKLSDIKVVNTYSSDIKIAVNDFYFLTDTRLLVGTNRGLFLLNLDNNLNLITNDLLLDKPTVQIMHVQKKVFLKTYFSPSKIYYSNLDYDLNMDKVTAASFDFKPFYPNPDKRDESVPGMIKYKNEMLFVLDSFRLVAYTVDLTKKLYEQDLTNLFQNVINQRVSELFIDRDGSLWLLTNGLGALVEQKKQTTFNILRNIPGDPSSISPVSLRQMVEDKEYGGVWITGYNGISLFKPESGKIERFPAEQSVYSLALIPKHNHYFLIGTDGAGMYLGNKKTGKIRNLHINNKKMPILREGREGQIFSIYVDKKGNVWFGALEGLLKFKLPLDLDKIPPIINVEYTSVNSNQLKTNSKVSHIYPVNDTLFYLATESQGILKYNIKEDKYSEIKYDSDDPKSISGNNIKTIYKSSDGNYWVGTTNGLNKWANDDYQNFRNNFKRISTRNGLPNNVIYGILEDKDHNLWISTNLGLSRFNPSKFIFDNFSKKDGLANDEFNTNSFLETSSGDMYFGSISGLTYFNPERVVDKSSYLKIAFTRLNVLNSNHTFARDISYDNHIELKNYENIFSVSFSALNYNSAGNTEYSYQLTGQDSTWIDLDQTQRVTFTNVSPGEYKLRVRARTAFTKWSDNYSELSITVLPPIWQTWWMYSVYALLFLLALYLARRYELSRQHAKQAAALEKANVENLLEINKAKSNFFANISHELRTPLTVVLGMLESIKSGIREKYDDHEIEEKLEVAYRSGKKQLNMVNQILNLTKLDAGEEKLNASVRNIRPFIRSICASFESLAGLNELELSFSSDYEIVPVNFDPDKIEKILNNLLSNAIKFTPAGGSIDVKIESRLNPEIFEENTTAVKKEERFVKITVKDTGMGIPEEKLTHTFERFFQVDNTSTRKYEGIGIGLSLTKELVELHNGNIVVESKFGEGTTFTVSLPIDFTSPPDEIKNTDYHLIKQPENLESNLSEPAPERKRRTSILIVEDNTDLRYYIKETLQTVYDILEASNGMEGIEIAEIEIPDLIITDVMMPNMDGFEMTKHLRESNVTCHIPIIMLTARAAEEDKFSGLEAGVDAYLTKPFSTKELSLRVQKLLELREKLYKKIGEGAFVNPLELKINSLDQQFLNKIKETVTANIGNENFSVEELSGIMAMSERQLRRKLSALIDVSPVAYIRKLRMKTARELLINGNGNVSQVSLEVGYSSFTAFTKAFKGEFGVPPSQIKT